MLKLHRTNMVGIMDLVAIKANPDEIIFIEVKDVKTEHKPLQKFRLRQLEKLGFKVVLDRRDQ